MCSETVRHDLQIQVYLLLFCLLLLLSPKEQPWGPCPRQTPAQLHGGDWIVLENTYFI